MPRKSNGLPPGVKAIRKPDGRVYYYWTRSTPWVRIHGEPGTPTFERSLRAAQAEPAVPAAPEGKKFKTLIDAYKASPEFTKKISDRTRREYLPILDRMADQFDFLFVEDLNHRSVRGDFIEWRNEMAPTPAMADRCIHLLSRVLSVAYNAGAIEVNHAQKLGALYDGGNRQEIVWPSAVLRRLLRHVTPEFGRLLLFARWTGIREADICRLQHGLHFDGRWITLQPSKTKRKTGVRIWLPVFALPPLERLIAKLPRRGPYLFTTETGRPWQPRNIQYHMGEAMAAAKLKDADLHFHDLRGTLIRQLEDAGCTDAEIASISGHKPAGRHRHGLGAYGAASQAQAMSAYSKLARALKNTNTVVQWPDAEKFRKLDGNAARK